MSSATIIFDEVRGALPSSVNPFLAIYEVFTSKFYPPIPRSFDYQLYVTVGIFSMYATVFYICGTGC